MSAIKWHLGHVVHNLRTERRWTQTQLGRKAGLNKATIVSVEKQDRNHGSDTYKKVAAAFGLTLQDLYGLIPSSQESQRPAGEHPTGTAGDRFPDERRTGTGTAGPLGERRRAGDRPLA